MHKSRFLAATGLLLVSALAQVGPGNSVAAVIDGSVTTGMSSLWLLDQQARTATKLTTPNDLAVERTNCVLMTSNATGFVGTNPLPANTPANIYGIRITGTGVTATKLNTTATAGGNAAQLALADGFVWFVTQNATGTGGIVQKMPLIGGPVTTVLDLTTITGWNGLANALCIVGSKVYVGAFDSGAVATTPGCIAAIDRVTNTGSILLALPQGKYISGTTNFNTGLVHMQGRGTQIHAYGVYGDYLVIDTVTATVVSHEFSGFGVPGTRTPNLANSFDYDPATGDGIVGSRDGACDRVASGQSAEDAILGVGDNATRTSNSVAGLSHLPYPTDASDLSYAGSGCAGNGGFRLTDSAWGLPTAGNLGFKLGVYSGTGGDSVVCLLGGTAITPGFDLTAYGMAGCNLNITSILAAIPLVLSGTGNGLGKASFPMPLSTGTYGLSIVRQWAEIQTTKTNILGVVVSNARRMIVLN